ncbi:hypothetical protein IFM53868_07829 [Aspergillus udagawae]|uniref:Uncharacterized protein n=1 Tax=Aspergillus udagawae TaxID=91492 RepID=A0ABQ1B721_9EURO|nr:hypothetical protein IFM53868_07829 [Aspergillus udagawae]GFG13316.1 hypothetical protein IFM5058_06387 [Aspergillus udagawae]
MSDSEDSNFVLVDPDDASVDPIPTAADETEIFRDWLHPTAYLRRYERVQEAFELKRPHPKMDPSYPSVPQWHSSPSSSALWIKARLVSLHRNRNKKANRPYFFSSAAHHHCERRFACFGARLDGTTSRLLSSSASVATGIKKENHQVHDIRFTELWNELLYIVLLLKKVSCIADALD